MNKAMFSCLFGLAMSVLQIGFAHAETLNGSLWSAWGYAGKKDVTSLGSEGEFIIDGDLTFNSKGSYSDEGAILAVIAEQVNAHGAFLCPYQIQCANAKRNHHSWTEYYHPKGWDKSKCAWFCEKGYSGPGCEKQYYVDNSRHDNVVGNLRYGLSRYTSGDRLNNHESEIAKFASWDYYWYLGTYKDNGEYDIILGVVKFLSNGVIVAPVQVGCFWNGWKGINSWVNHASRASNTQKLLCKQGYQPNAANTDCVHATADMLEKINPVFCGNFPESGFNTSIHRLKKASTGNCYIYVCKDPNKAFPTVGEVNKCEDCAVDVRGGPSPYDGTCVTCNQLGEYFDSAEGACKAAKGFSHLDMQFGYEKTKADYKNKLDGQCWTKTSPEEYKNCVFGIQPEE